MSNVYDPLTVAAVRTFVGNIATEIERGFMPLTFLCSCHGAHPECSEARTATAYAQKDTVERIVAMLRRVASETNE